MANFYGIYHTKRETALEIMTVLDTDEFTLSRNQYIGKFFVYREEEDTGRVSGLMFMDPSVFISTYKIDGVYDPDLFNKLHVI